MGSQALVPERHYLIERIKPDNHGFKMRTVYTGSLRLKPKGWRVIKELP